MEQLQSLMERLQSLIEKLEPYMEQLQAWLGQLQGLAAQHLPSIGWIVFGVAVTALLAIDLFAHRGERGQSAKVALIWSVIWIGAGLLFAGFVWFRLGGQATQEYLAAYAIEKSLSLDNLFLFLIIFESLGVPKKYQHEVLFWGILGAIVFRGIFIFLGAQALERWEWVSYLFGAILFYAAYKSFREDPAKQEESKAVKWLSKHLPVTEKPHQGQFIAKENNQRVVTPLLIALIAIELTDVMFAIDSVAAALSMTRDIFILYSSNIFAILGLRALYLLLAHTIAELEYLHYGLAVVLGFAGVKLIIDRWVHIHPLLSVGVIVMVIGMAAWASVRKRKKAAAKSTA